jgi:hypothetical protein
MPSSNYHKFHSFTLSGREGRINFLGATHNGPQGTTIVLDYNDVYELVLAIGDAALLEIVESRREVRPRHLTLVTGSDDPRNGAWSTNDNAHPAHHPHKQEGA